MLKLQCFSLPDFKLYVEDWQEVPEDVAIISITDSSDTQEYDEEHIFPSSERVLNLDFDDIDPYSFDDIEYPREPNGDIHYGSVMLVPFKEEYAKIAIPFILNNLGKHFLIHCYAGVSRSQAFVRFILDTFPEYTIADCRQCNLPRTPNYHVLNVLKRVYREEFCPVSGGVS